MKKIILSAVALVISVFCYCQCPMVYVKKTFYKVEYYTNTKDSLKLLRTSNSTNSIEIVKNTYSDAGDLFSASGNLVNGERYNGFINQYECKNVAGHTKYTLYTNDGRTTDTWIVYVNFKGEVTQVSLISTKDNMVLILR